MYSRLFGIPYRFCKLTTHYYRSIVRKIDNPQRSITPVFLIGCGRSGTNMVLDSLGKSFQVDVFNEDHPAAFEKWRLKDFSIIENLNRDGYAKIKLYKPILDSHLARNFLVNFQESKIIFVFRHYSDVINSSIKYFGKDSWPIRVEQWVKNDFAEFASAPPPDSTIMLIKARWHNDMSTEDSIGLYWLFYNSLFFDLGLHKNNRVVLVKYENIVTQPINDLRKLCQFLGIHYDSKMSKGIFRSSINREPTPILNNLIRNDCDDLWYKLCDRVSAEL